MRCGDMDFLCFEKPKCRKRQKTRRNAVQDRRWNEIKTDGVITKKIYDPGQKLTKNQLQPLLSGMYDGMGTERPYTLNKNRRWEVTPSTLLQNCRNRDADLFVLEQRNTHKCAECIRSVNYLNNNGNLVQKTSARMGTRLKNLFTDHRVHSGLKDCECCRSYNEEPRVEYRIITAHENQWITTGQITGGGHDRWIWPAFVRCHWKRNYLKHWENLDEFEEERQREEIEKDWDESDYDEETENYRDRRFCLGDFIVDKPLNMKEWVIVK